MIEYDNYDIKRRTLQHIQYQCIYKNLTHRHHTFNSVSNSFGCWLDLLLLADHTRETGLIEVYFVLLESSQWNTKWMCSWKVVVVLSKSDWCMKKKLVSCGQFISLQREKGQASIYLTCSAKKLLKNCKIETVQRLYHYIILFWDTGWLVKCLKFCKVQMQPRKGTAK